MFCSNIKTRLRIPIRREEKKKKNGEEMCAIVLRKSHIDRYRIRSERTDSRRNIIFSLFLKTTRKFDRLVRAVRVVRGVSDQREFPWRKRDFSRHKFLREESNGRSLPVAVPSLPRGALALRRAGNCSRILSRLFS